MGWTRLLLSFSVSIAFVAVNIYHKKYELVWLVGVRGCCGATAKWNQ